MGKSGDGSMIKKKDKFYIFQEKEGILRKMNFTLKIDLVDMSPTSSIFRYPKISEQEKELLCWEIVGDIGIICDDVLLTQSLVSELNCITYDYVWHFITDLHRKTPDLLKGKCVQQEFFDNPDVITFTPEAEYVKITFQCRCQNHHSGKECKILMNHLFSALLHATRKLEDDLLEMNPLLGDSDELVIIKMAYNDTLNLISKNGIHQ
jgi:hypothetical protein